MKLAITAVILSSLLGCRDDVVLGNRDGDASTDAAADAASDASTDAADAMMDVGTDATDGGMCGEVCPAEACGPRPGLDQLCEDDIARSAAGECRVGTDGTCQWEIVTCIEDRICANMADCGPPSGAPSFMCSDGSIGGNTGVCLRSPDGCDWYFRDCPAIECDEAECGPPPAQPNVECPDGVNVSGPTGRCVRPAGPVEPCAWEIAMCPWVEALCD